MPEGRSSLTDLIVRMDERGSLEAIRRRLDAGDDPVALLGECRSGMERVGELYEQGTYFISALIMAGEIFREAAEILIPHLEAAPPRPKGAGKIVIATVKGDIHDIGKNIVITLLDTHGFAVVDLGVDVAAARIAEAVLGERPDPLHAQATLADELKRIVTGVQPAADGRQTAAFIHAHDEISEARLTGGRRHRLTLPSRRRPRCRQSWKTPAGRRGR